MGKRSTFLPSKETASASRIDQLLARLELLSHSHREIRSTVIALRKALQQEAGK